MPSPIFGQVDQYLSQLYSLEDEVLLQTEASIRENGMPEHSVSAVQGQFLFFLAQMCQAKRIIEAGTLGGYSTIWLAREKRATHSILQQVGIKAYDGLAILLVK